MYAYVVKVMAMKFHALQPDNPILRAEINYQKRVMPRWMRWFDRMGVIIVALVSSVAVVLFPLKENLYGNYSLGMGSQSVILFVLWITQLIVIFRSLLAGVNVMQPYTLSHHWDTLALTGITTQKFLLGTFWGALYQMRGWTVAFGIIKLAGVAFVTANLIVFCYFTSLFNARWIGRYVLEPTLTSYYDEAISRLSFYSQVLPTTNRILLVVTFSVAISILEVMASVALGMMGGIIFRGLTGFTLAVICRLVPIALFTIWPDYPHANGNILWRWYEYTWFSLADGGSSGIIRSGSIWRGGFDNNAILKSMLPAFWAAIVMFIAYLLVSLLISHLLLRRRGFLTASSE